MIITQVLYWLLGFVSHYFNFVCSGSQAEKVHELNEEIGKLLAKAEQLGAEGNVDEAQKVLQEVEKVRTRKKDAEVGVGESEETHCLNGCCSFCSSTLHHLMCSFVCLVNCSPGRIQKLHARVQFPAAEAAGVRSVLRLPGPA